MKIQRLDPAKAITLLPLLIALEGCTTTAVPGTEPGANDVAGVTAAAADAGTMADALQASGLAAELGDEGPYTIFVPVNTAFDALPAGAVEGLLASDNREVLLDLLNFHVVPGRYDLASFRDGQALKTREGKTLKVTVKGGLVEVNGVRLRTADLEATNGVVHLIDGVLTTGLDARQFAGLTPQLSTLLEVMDASGLGGTLSGNTLITLFAPTNAAFANMDAVVQRRMLAPANQAMLQKILNYHMLPGRYLASDMREGADMATIQGQTVHITVSFGRKVNAANILTTDVRVSNGVVHVIDRVLQENLSVYDMFTLGGFDGFVAALATANDAGLESALRYGRMTAFAPSNEAFATLSAATRNDPVAMASLLRGHIVRGWVGKGELVNGARLETLRGDSLTVQTGGGVSVRSGSGSASVGREVGAANGVIHAVGGVL